MNKLSNLPFKKYVVEMIGTFLLVFLACGTAAITLANVVATALAFGLVLMVLVYTIGPISGCHVNPAVSLGMLISKRMNWKDCLFYMLFQIVGAILGAALLYGILVGSSIDIIVWGTNNVIDESVGGYISSVALELILTFIFIYVILEVTKNKDRTMIAGIIIGLTLTLVHLLAINLTGTSVNPARSIGPALMRLAFGGGTDALIQLWVFIIAPLAGGALAAFSFNWMNKVPSSKLTLKA